MFETVEHYFLHCSNYINIRNVLKIKVEQLTEFKIETILFGSPNLLKEQNQLVLDFVNVYILESKRFFLKIFILEIFVSASPLLSYPTPLLGNLTCTSKRHLYCLNQHINYQW